MLKNLKLNRHPNVRIAQELFVFVLLILTLFIINTIYNGVLTFGTIMSILRSSIEIGIIVLAFVFVILTGGIDLSVGSIMALSIVVFGEVFNNTNNIMLAVLASLGTGIACGIFNGFCIGYLKMAAWVVTLCGMYIYEGIALGISEAATYSGFPEGFYFLGQGYIAGIPTQIVLYTALVLVFSFILTATKLGRQIRSVGFSSTASHYAGVNVPAVKLSVYTFSGLACALAGIIYISRISIGKADAGEGYVMDIITAVVLGGVSTSGGIGSIRGATLGLITVGMLRGCMTLIQIPSEVTSIILGIILIISVVLTDRNAIRLFNRSGKLFPNKR